MTKTLHTKLCPECEAAHRSRPYFNTWNRRQVYCSDRCKQAAHRRRMDAKTGSVDNLRRRAQNGADTRRKTYVKTVCVWCGTVRTFDMTSAARRKYCTDACKQAAYRANTQFNDTGRADVQTLVSLRWWIPTVMTAYRHKYNPRKFSGFSHVWQNADIVENEDGSVSLLDADGVTLHTFTDATRATEDLNALLDIGVLRS